MWFKEARKYTTAANEGFITCKESTDRVKRRDVLVLKKRKVQDSFQICT